MTTAARLTVRRSTPRNSIPDQSRLVYFPLLPILVVDVIWWKLLGHGWIAGLWFLLLIGCIALLRRT